MRDIILFFTALLCAPFLATCTLVVAPPKPVPAATPLPLRASSLGVEAVWRTELGGTINWRPMLLTTTDGDQRLIVASEAGRVVALDPTSGIVMWTFTPPSPVWTDSVTVLDTAVFVASAGALVTLLDGATGAVRWQRNIQPAQKEALSGLEARAKPTLAADIIYIPTAGVGSRATVSNPTIHAPLIALDYKGGGERWRFESDCYLLRAPFVEAERNALYVGGNFLPPAAVKEGGALRIYALNQEDGSERWRYESADGLLKSLWADQQVLIFAAYRDFLVGLESRSGAEIYRHNTGNWVQSFVVLPQLSAQLAAPGLIYGSANAFLNAIDPVNGAYRWRYNVSGTFNYPIGNAVLDGTTLYFISQRGDLHALNPTDGTLRWRYATHLESRDGIEVGGGYLFVGSVDGGVTGFRLQ